MSYNIKTVDYGYKEKQIFFASPISQGINTSAETRGNYKSFSEKERQESDRKRLMYYRKKLSEIKEIAMMNDDLNTMVTLTFRENVTSYKDAVGAWQLFIKRLKYRLGRHDLKFICTWELQKRGAYHFHFLTNIGFLEHSVLEEIWSNGFVWIEKIGTEKDRHKAVAYALKYSLKEVMHHIEDCIRGQRYIFTSNNLALPKVSKELDFSKKIEDVIFNNMENVIKDGSYSLEASDGTTLNVMRYVTYRK